jgi:AcrR family transcriptional regulator
MKTRAAIQRHALRLFREQGYAATTVEQIAEAAEVSPSTFFRYFKTKEDVVLQDDFDRLLVLAFRAQPASLSPVQALRAAMRSVFQLLAPDAWEQARQRQELAVSVPELRATMLEEFIRALDTIAATVAERAGRRPGDLQVRTLAGAVLGVTMAAWLAVSDAGDGDFFAHLDAAMAHLEAGLPL